MTLVKLLRHNSCTVWFLSNYMFERFLFLKRILYKIKQSHLWTLWTRLLNKYSLPPTTNIPFLVTDRYFIASDLRKRLRESWPDIQTKLLEFKVEKTVSNLI